jgi:hypothetical protein
MISGARNLTIAAAFGGKRMPGRTADTALHFAARCEFRFNPARDSDLMSAAVPI